MALILAGAREEGGGSARRLYRVAAALQGLLAVGHTLGFQQSDPSWGVDAMLASMQALHFELQGFSRSYWDLFTAAGFSAGLFYVFGATLAWQLGSLHDEVLAELRLTAWAFALCFLGIAAVSWCYLFAVPIAFSSAIAACLLSAAWLSGRGSGP